MSAQLAIDFLQARTARDAGMRRAIDHAQDLCFDWPERAYAFLEAYARHNAEFISEDVSDAAHANPRFPTPPTDRAWGAIYRKAANAGLIEQCGAGRSRRRHASICPKWRSLVFMGGVA
jgi:hypothetical protein